MKEEGQTLLPAQMAVDLGMSSFDLNRQVQQKI